MKVLYFPVAVAVAILLCQAIAVTGCVNNVACAQYNGTCQLKTAVCNGTEWNTGCSGRDCTCCIPSPENESVCIRKPWCQSLGGTCGAYTAATCAGALDPKGCHGTCACCVPRVIANSGCKDKGQCNSLYGGYCFTKNVHPCKGFQWNGGCSGTNCACCVLDTTKCVIKKRCSDNGGTCVAPGLCNKPNSNPNWCVGLNCTCCY
ncbi:keratin-associated protein 5-1-like [Procambarus clarkii]|uniref:keratin-associated protein 5-1-like n=1 Tax=Procambarus clarkii TaxID=6728 RepID=UPI001E670849|nr:keratin-associated protein 5-7-like [Procambarus clarkii]XP_045607072.1 keratin-associated protein 5-7-like [Procambarus clarkii]